MPRRYANRRKFQNYNNLYRKKFRNKRGKFVEQYFTAVIPDITEEMYATWDIAEHIWGYEDRYWKLAEKYYGNHEEWWRIAWFNKKPLESQIEIGEIVLVPVNLQEVVVYLGY